MFSKAVPKTLNDKSLPKAINQNGETPSIIAADLKIVGDLVCGGSIEIEGDVQGNVTCSHVTIRRTGAVKGDISADEIFIDGGVTGLVKGQNVTVTESGRVTGIIMYESLSVRDGAFIDGQCKSADNMRRDDVEQISLDEIPASSDDMVDIDESNNVTDIQESHGATKATTKKVKKSKK